MRNINNLSIALLAISFCVGGDLKAAADENHIANGGAIFFRDYNHPALGVAYRDPSGLVWGAGNRFGKMNQLVANEYCQRLGARLPSVDDFKSLAMSLGSNSANGYSVFSEDGATPVLPNLLSGYYWSSTLGSDDDGAYEFSSDDGYMAFTSRGQFDSVLCVSE